MENKRQMYMCNGSFFGSPVTQFSNGSFTILLQEANLKTNSLSSVILLNLVGVV